MARAAGGRDGQRGDAVADEQIGRRVRRMGRAAVSVLLLSLGAIALLANILLMQQRHDAAIIDIAGYQRALSQRLAALVHRANGHWESHDEVEQERGTLLAEIAHARLRMQDGLGQLTGTDGAGSPPAAASAALRHHYHHAPHPLSALTGRFLADIEAFLVLAQNDAAPETERNGLARRIEAAALGPLLPALDAAVRLHRAEAEARQDLTRWKLVGALAALAVAIAGLWGTVFRPMSRRIGQDAAALDRAGRLDALTGLANRQGFVAALDHALVVARDSGHQVGLLAIDLDWFKEVNDTDGHAAGDAVLHAVAARLTQAMRAHDVAGRLGGDEFAVAYTRLASQADLDAIAERVRLALHQPVPFTSRALRIGASLGIAMAPADGDDARQLLLAADTALRAAKQRGKGMAQHFTSEHGETAARERLIRAALMAPEGMRGVSVVLQPQIACADGAIVGYEALARWTHPTLGPISPATFIPVAEACGALAPVAAAIRDQAMQALAGLRAEGLPAPRVAINLTTAEVAAPDLVEQIEQAAARHGLVLPDLELEITERVLLERISPQTQASLETLAARGVHLSIDDFGTGYSGIPALQRLPFSNLKIDRSFVSGVAGDLKAQMLLRALLGLANGLMIDVVAEGVETEEDLSFLRAMGCHGAQGYVIARPMAPPALADWLRRQRGPQLLAAEEMHARHPALPVAV